MNHLPTPDRCRTRLSRRLAAVALPAALAGWCSLPATASAQGVKAYLSPMTSFGVGGFGGGRRYEYCAGAYGGGTVPLEWEVQIQNDNPAAATFTFDINVQAGLEGSYFNLNCPPTFLPAGVDPVNDVTCSKSAQTLQVRNIRLQPCEKVFLRFTVNPDGPRTGDNACMGGTISLPTVTIPTVSPLDDQVPREGGDTCLYPNPMCGSFQTRDLVMRYVMTDENGPPMLPGDFVTFKAMMDFRYFDFLPPPRQVYFKTWDGAIDPSMLPLPLPTYIDFIEFTPSGRPFAAQGAVYDYNAGTRTLSVYDPGVCPPAPCNITVDQATPQWTDIVEWRGQVNCLAPNLLGQCAQPLFRVVSPFDTFGEYGGDDWHTYTDGQDPTCATPTEPDLSTSVKTLADGDGSGDAQPGELLTFSVTAINTLPCPEGLMSCECAATRVVVKDDVDLTFLDAASINPLDGGVLTPPAHIEWIIPSVNPAATFGSRQTVRFEARVKATGVADGNLICNSATLNSRERMSVADGGISNCPTQAPIGVAVAPCMPVRIPAGPSLVLDKSLAPAQACHAIGSTVQVSITVRNVGVGSATSVLVRDTLHPSLCPFGLCQVSNISDGGGIAGRNITWPALATLVGGGGSKTYTFDLTIPSGLSDGAAIANVATTTSTEIPSPVDSNTALIKICAPRLEFTKESDKFQYLEGDTITWTIRTTNIGSSTATGLRVFDVIDVTRLDEATLAFTPATGSYDGVSKTYTWPTLATLAPTESATFTISGTVLAGTAGGRVCNRATARWEQTLADVVSSPSTGTCSDIIDPTSGCLVSSLGRLDPVKGVESGGDAVFTWPALAANPPEYHLNSVTLKTDIPPAGACPAVSGSRRTTCGSGVARDSQSTPTGTHTGAIADPSPLLFYQVYAACASGGDSEGPF